MATREEKIKELNALYAKATTEEEYTQTYKSAVNYYHEASRSEAPFQVLAEIMLPGYWAEYYQLKKFPHKNEAEQKQKIDFHVSWVDQYYRQVPKEDVELKLNYGYLLSVVLNGLKGDFEEARKVDAELQRLAKETKNVAIALKIINAQGLTAMQKKDWQGAIAIFDTAERLFSVPEVSRSIPDARQPLANILNNRGLAKLNLSDEKQKRSEKRGLISSAIIDLWNAAEEYMKVIPSPLKHIEGVENRLIMAASRLLLTERFVEEVEIGRKIKEAFEAKNREEAKRLIFSLKELKVERWDKIEGEIPAGTMTFIGSIQIGLRMADEFLEKHKEVK